MESFTVALCQVRAFDLDRAEENLAGLLGALDAAGQAGARLVALPECAYPAYYLGDAHPYRRPGVRPFEEVAALFAEKARRYGYWLAAGMAVPHPSGGLSNSGVVFTPEGAIAGRHDKCFLWHFDANWFQRGDQLPVFDAGFCRFGVLICADGRQPEVARSLAVGGAEVILDLTAWVSSGASVSELRTSQWQYIMPVRAFENGAWVCAADKWGPEAGTIVYAGHSCVIDPAGEIRTFAATAGDALVTFELHPWERDLVPRRPSLYGRLVEATECLPAAALLEEALVPARQNRRVAVVPAAGAFDPGGMVSRYETLRRQDAALAVFAGTRAEPGWEEAIARAEAAVRALGGSLVFAVDSGSRRDAVLVTPEGVHHHQATHGRNGDLGEVNAPVVETPAGRVAVVCGDEGDVPEVARGLALEGADIVAWPLFEAHPLVRQVARCRSDENRVFTAAAWPDGGIITAPTGAVLAEVPEGTGVAMAAQVNAALARIKEMAPGTDAILSRTPAAYERLVR
jgi:predicted amidohydrolase